MAGTPLEAYLCDVRDIHGTGTAVPETSYYGALERLTNAVGKGLKPTVRLVLHPGNRGAGLPDGGLFTADQFSRKESEGDRRGKMLAGQSPARGVVEVKGVASDVNAIAATPQVQKYLDLYNQVLVTNLRDFLLLGRDPTTGAPVPRDRFTIAASGAAFWTAAAKPVDTDQAHGEQFCDFIARILLSGAPLTDPKELATFLASYARDAKALIENNKLPALARLREALEAALGVSFHGPKGDPFFRSTLVQTLFYGIFSAWVLWSRKHLATDETAQFDWRTAAWELRVPMIRALFEQVAQPGRLGPLGLIEVLDRAGDVLNRVDRAAFFARFEQDAAVQYFYEPFLEAFDPQLRKELGVWYTPREIIQYQVERVDRALRDELGIADGLADERVHVLDPCCGTGAYLVEVLKRIQKTMKENGSDDGLGGIDLKRAATTRIFGFEILPAPFVVAHLQLGLLLQNEGIPLSDEEEERVGVYLTNALTGWAPVTEEGQRRVVQLAATYPELGQERDAAEQIKREKPILVVLGNPPYNAFAGTAPEEEDGLVEPYKAGLISEWGIKKFNLDELYVRFFRLAERRIAGSRTPGEGIVCFISSASYLGDASFVVMRRRLLDGFDTLHFDNLNGDSRETGKVTPDGDPDPSVFSTEYNKAGIRVGTAVALMVRKKRRKGSPPHRSIVRYREFWGAAKRAELLESIDASNFDEQYETFQPTPGNYFSFRSQGGGADYQSWPKLSEIWATGKASNGLMEKRGGALFSIDRSALEARMQAYYNPSVTWAQLEAMGTGLTRDAAGFDADKVRGKVIREDKHYRPDHLRRYTLRPMDTVWAYYSAANPLWNRSRPGLWAQCWEGNRFFLTRFQAATSPEGPPFFFTSCLSDDHLLTPDAIAVPLRLKVAPAPTAADSSTGDLFGGKANGDPDVTMANLSENARYYLATVGIPNPDADEKTAALVWMHALAIGYSPAYLAENEAGIRTNYPRVPLPATRELLAASASLGRQVASLLNSETGVPQVTTGKVLLGLATIGQPVRADGKGNLDENAGDLTVRAGWGNPTKAGVMPGQGDARLREYTPKERAALVGGQHGDATLALLGDQTYDIYLNDVACWANIPAAVWGYTIGGYQVIKKWLSYREESVLGRGLTPDEVREVRDMARRIVALLLLAPELDANYNAVKKSTYAWPSSSADEDEG